MKLEPNAADVEAATEFTDDYHAAGPSGEPYTWRDVHAGYLAGLLHERARAAKVAEACGGISSKRSENAMGEWIAELIRKGPQP